MILLKIVIAIKLIFGILISFKDNKINFDYKMMNSLVQKHSVRPIRFRRKKKHHLERKKNGAKVVIRCVNARAVFCIHFGRL